MAYALSFLQQIEISKKKNTIKLNDNNNINDNNNNNNKD